MTILRERLVWVRTRELRRFELTAREKTNIRRRLRRLRKRLGTWKRVAEHLGLAYQHVRDVVSRRGPTPAVAFKIAKAERISIEAVLHGARWGTEWCPMCGAPRA